MSYLTVEVDIDHGKIVAREPEKIPEKGTALLTILEPREKSEATLRPFGLAKGEFSVPADFNAPLSPEVLREFEGG